MLYVGWDWMGWMVIGGRTKCQPDKMPIGHNANQRLALCPDFFSVVGILSAPNFWLAFCPDHLNMFWHFVGIMKITFQITFH